jgi:DUF971 family protein
MTSDASHAKEDGVSKRKQTPTPLKVDILPHEVRIHWGDGKVTSFTHLALRRRCPCAICKTASSGPLGPPPVAENVRALDYSAVGRYALQFHWSDGHDSGIYPLTDLHRS